jgi:hypothetical protein
MKAIKKLAGIELPKDRAKDKGNDKIMESECAPRSLMLIALDDIISSRTDDRKFDLEKDALVSLALETAIKRVDVPLIQLLVDASSSDSVSFKHLVQLVTVLKISNDDLLFLSLLPPSESVGIAIASSGSEKSHHSLLMGQGQGQGQEQGKGKGTRMEDNMLKITGAPNNILLMIFLLLVAVVLMLTYVLIASHLGPFHITSMDGISVPQFVFAT